MTRIFASLHTKQDVVDELNRLIDQIMHLENAEKERDTARFQIERAILQLQSHAYMDPYTERSEAAYGDLIRSVQKQLQSWIKKEGGPWYQRG